MDAHDWLSFFRWLDSLPKCHQALREDLTYQSIISVPDACLPTLEKACTHRFIQRFDWLSNEVQGLLDDMQTIQSSQRNAQRNEILRVATAKRQAENKKKGVLFSSRRAKWEKDTEMSRLEKQSIALKDEHAQHVEAQALLVTRRIEMLESLNKLPNIDEIKLCSSGIYRLKQSGKKVWKKLLHIGEASCHGWALEDILEIGHLLPPTRSNR